MHAPLVQEVENSLLQAAGVEVQPRISHRIQMLHERLSSNTCARQQLEYHKGRMGALTVHCQQCSMHTVAAHYRMHAGMPAPASPRHDVWLPNPETTPGFVIPCRRTLGRPHH